MADPGAKRARISEALALILVSHTAARISVGELLDALSDHGFGLLILVLALINAIPGPHIPGLSLPSRSALSCWAHSLRRAGHRPGSPSAPGNGP